MTQASDSYPQLYYKNRKNLVDSLNTSAIRCKWHLSKFSAQNKNFGNNRFSQAVVPSKTKNKHNTNQPKPKPPTQKQNGLQNLRPFCFSTIKHRQLIFKNLSGIIS